jgi:hypothetical protein
MTTSANVIEYTIYKNGEHAGSFRTHQLCKYPDYAELLKYQPLKEHTIVAWGYDEEEEEWCDEEENLEEKLKRMAAYNKWLKAYFNGEKTAEQILQEFKEIYAEQTRKMHEHFAKEREKIKNKLT